MRITLIAAMSKNRVIGRDGDLPWHLPNDLKRFKAVTRGHQIVMGRRTFESLPGALPHRRNIVVTRNPDYRAESAVVVGSLDAAVRDAEKHAGSPTDELFIAGGAVLYEAALPIADRLDFCLIDAEIDGDTFFPAFEEDAWVVEHEERFAPDESHAFGYSFVSMVRMDSDS